MVAHKSEARPMGKGTKSFQTLDIINPLVNGKARVMLMGRALEAFKSLKQGAVVFITNAPLLPESPKFPTLTYRIDDPRLMTEIGEAVDVRKCASITRQGNPCENWVCINK